MRHKADADKVDLVLCDSYSGYLFGELVVLFDKLCISVPLLLLSVCLGVVPDEVVFSAVLDDVLNLASSEKKAFTSREDGARDHESSSLPLV